MLVLAAIGGYIFYTKAKDRELALSAKYRAELNELKETVEQNEEGWALKENIERGQLITEEMIEKVTLPKAAKSEDILTSLEIKTLDYYAKTDLQANTVIVESMVYEEKPIGNDEREGEYSFIELPTDLVADDYIDVRIQFPNGDDYIFLSKKKVKKTEGLTVWIDMDEGDQLTMSSAMVDAFVEEGKIYAMPYIDGPMQVGAQITYPVKKNVLALIESSPNIINRAKLNLEAQNRERLEASLLEMSAENRQKLRQGQAENNNKRKQDDHERELNAANQFDQEDVINDSHENGEGDN